MARSQSRRGYSTDESIVNTSLDIKKLKLIDTVDRTAFDSASGVRTKDGYYALPISSAFTTRRTVIFIATLQSAKSNYTEIRTVRERYGRGRRQNPHHHRLEQVNLCGSLPLRREPYLFIRRLMVY